MTRHASLENPAICFYIGCGDHHLRVDYTFHVRESSLGSERRNHSDVGCVGLCGYPCACLFCVTTQFTLEYAKHSYISGGGLQRSVTVMTF